MYIPEYEDEEVKVEGLEELTLEQPNFTISHDAHIPCSI